MEATDSVAASTDASIHVTAAHGQIHPSGVSSTDASVQALLNEFADVFAELTGKGKFREDTPECIPLVSNAAPPNRPPFRLSMSERAEVEKQVTGLLEKGFVQPSASPYGAPVLFVPKPDGSWRMCIDYRALNKLTRRNTYPLPRIDDLLDNLSGAKYFSSLDLASGYHQIVLQPNDCEKTAFNTHIGKYEFKVLPFGLTNAPAVFQSVMNQVFREHLNKRVCVYLDDILVFSQTPEQHVKDLRTVLELLRAHGFKCRPHKCEFFKPELKFLGHIVGADGMKPDPAKIATINNWPTPKSVYDVRAFLGLANYFRKYIRGYAALATPLTDLLKGLDKQDKKGKLMRWNKLPQHRVEQLQAEFLSTKWTDRCDSAFRSLKSALSSAPVLVLPNFSKPFQVVADACETPPAIGAVLLQDGHPVAYLSRKLSGPELNYSVSDIEMLAIISALREWRCYLEGNQFTLITDHQPNTYLDSPSNTHTIKRRARWLSESAGYDYTWLYRPGRLNPADPISRAPQHYQSSQDSMQANARNPITVLSMLFSRHVHQGPYGSQVVSARNAHPRGTVQPYGTDCSRLHAPASSVYAEYGLRDVTPGIAICAALRILYACTATSPANFRCEALPMRPDQAIPYNANDNSVRNPYSDPQLALVSAGQAASTPLHGMGLHSTEGDDTPNSQTQLCVKASAGDTDRRSTLRPRAKTTGDLPSPRPTSDPVADQVDNEEQPETGAHDTMDPPAVNPERRHTEQTVLNHAHANFVSRLLAGYLADANSVSVASQRTHGMHCDSDGLYWTSAHRLVVPAHDDLHHDCIESVHSHPFSGHYGVARTLHKAQEIFYWPNMRQSVVKFVRHCDSCQRAKARNSDNNARINPLDIPGRRWESISMDFIMDLPVTSAGNDAIVVFVDRLSKMVHLAACTKTITAQQTATLFIDCVFKHHGMPTQIVSDRDVRFESLFWRELVLLLRITHSKSSRFHPQTDGQTERMNRTLEDTLRHYVGPYQNDWDKLLPFAEFAMNNAWHSGINNTPFMLNYGQHPDIPTTAFLRARHPQINKFVGRWSQQIAHAKHCLAAAQDRMRAQDRHHAKPIDVLVPGDQVLVHIRHFKLAAGLKHKLGPRWLGPFTVIKDIGPNHQAYRLEFPATLQRMLTVIHVSDLKRYFPGRYQPPPLPDLIDGVEEYEVDFISETRREGKRREYKVHWVGYVHPTWEKESQLTNCPEKLREFWQWKQLDCPHPIRGE